MILRSIKLPSLYFIELMPAILVLKEHLEEMVLRLLPLYIKLFLSALILPKQSTGLRLFGDNIGEIIGNGYSADHSFTFFVKGHCLYV